MKGNPVRYTDFVVYPEYCELSVEQLKFASKGDDKFHIASTPAPLMSSELGSNLGVVVKGGEVVWSRAKYRLFATEKWIRRGDTPPEIVTLGEWRALILICYELLFPQDYLVPSLRPLGTYAQVDIVIHMVGFPMFDVNQKEGWVAMQDTLSLLFGCPLVCCCGGQLGGMNISRIIER